LLGGTQRKNRKIRMGEPNKIVQSLELQVKDLKKVNNNKKHRYALSNGTIKREKAATLVGIWVLPLLRTPDGGTTT